MPPKYLTDAQIEQVQTMRYEGASNDEIKRAIPSVTDALLGKYAPAELRGSKKKLAEYIAAHPGVDYNELPFWKNVGGPSTVGGQLRGLSQAGLVTYKERPITPVNGHGAKGGESQKGFYDIRLTPKGERRISISRPFNTSPVHAKLTEYFSEHSEPTPEETPASVAPEPAGEVVEQQQSNERYPLLLSLLNKAKQISAANDLIQRAVILLGDAGMEDEALIALETVGKSTPTFSDLEMEYMRHWEEDHGVTNNQSS
jgi:hypothetical protein